jgi:hypothetical protein
MRQVLPRSKSRLLNTALICGISGLLLFGLALTAKVSVAGQTPPFLQAMFWVNLFLQPLCLGAVWLTRKAPRNFPFRLLVWVYIVAGAAYIVFPVGLKLVKGA